MNGSVLLCMLLFVGSASAWHSWWWFQPKNKMTECGMYNSLVKGEWMIGFTKTDFDTFALLNLFKRLDVNKDGFLTADEANNVQEYIQLDPTLTFDTGVLRCNDVAFLKRFLGVDQEVANTAFTMSDSNGDELLSFSDNSNFLVNDANDDGKVSICELFKSYVDLFALAENRVFQKDIKADELIKKYSNNNNVWDFFNW